MKLTRLRKLGRFKNPDTNQQVNIHKGTRVGRNDEWFFYLRSGVRVFISEKDFYNIWKQNPVAE